MTDEVSPEEETTTPAEPDDEVEGFGLLDFKPLGKVPTPKQPDYPEESITFEYGGLQVQYKAQKPD